MLIAWVQAPSKAIGGAKPKHRLHSYGRCSLVGLWRGNPLCQVRDPKKKYLCGGRWVIDGKFHILQEIGPSHGKVSFLFTNTIDRYMFLRIFCIHLCLEAT